MTQKEWKEVFITLMSIKSTASMLDDECGEFCSIVSSYARDIVRKCESCIGKLK